MEISAGTDDKKTAARGAVIATNATLGAATNATMGAPTNATAGAATNAAAAKNTIVATNATMGATTNAVPLWARTTKNRDVSTGPLARPFDLSFAPLTHLLAPPCLLCLCAPLRSLVHSLAHFAYSFACGEVYE